MPSTGRDTSDAELTPLERVIERAAHMLGRAEALLPSPPTTPDYSQSIAFRWRKQGGRGAVVPVAHPHRIALKDLQGIEAQMGLVDANTRQFVEGVPANNVLLTGARGTGKSSLVKAVLGKYSARGLRLIEMEKQDLVDLPDLVDRVADARFRFILFCDDLSFEADEPAYKALKAVLDGSIAATSDNVLIYATSNRRHLMPEFMSENLETEYLGDEIHPGETVEEKISLSERFGLWVSFYPFDQDHYLAIARHWVERLGVPVEDVAGMEREALQWALARGSRSGRVAWHFARDYAGRAMLKARGARRRK
jgi:predicted AAA+ superfamily ATPase